MIMIKTRVVHRDCGGLMGWFLGETKKGDAFESKTFERADGSIPVFGSKIREKCPKCREILGYPGHFERILNEAGL